MYAIWCVLTDGSEGWFHFVNQWDVSVGAVLSKDIQIVASTSASELLNLPNVLSAEAREVCVVEARELHQLRAAEDWVRALIRYKEDVYNIDIFHEVHLAEAAYRALKEQETPDDMS